MFSLTYPLGKDTANTVKSAFIAFSISLACQVALLSAETTETQTNNQARVTDVFTN